VTQKEEKEHVYTILVGKIEDMIPLEELVVKEIIITIIIDLKGILSLNVE
jgi:hypothetical protein